MRISRPTAGVVADANVLLSAAIGKAALRVFTEFEVRICATEFNCDEVEEYLPRLARKYRLDSDLLAIQWTVLAIERFAEAAYAGRFEGAASSLAGRDPDDAYPLALAMALGLPLWSNDSDLRDKGVPCHPTAELLALLERGELP